MIGILATAEMVDDGLQLGRFSALRDQDRDIAGSSHAEVAVDGFGEVEEDRGRPGRSEGRGDLAANVPGLAKAADDQLAAAAGDQSDGAFEAFA